MHVASYIGRFAPSPTGPLHFGSLVAAVASYCDAKVNHGKWLVRMEDIDKPREMKGAAIDILRTLEAFGFEWDGDIIVQNQRTEVYENALQTLKNLYLVYACTCSRKEIADSSNHIGIEGAIYNKNCLFKTVKLSAPAAWRLNTAPEPDLTVLKCQISFNDAIQGEISQNIAQEIGDFVLKRADGCFAYQLAVVVDDATQGITHIVRGADLLNSTARQIYLQQLLGLPTPHYAHLPVAVNAQNEKLSKQTLAAPITAQAAPESLFTALQFLGQQPPSALKKASLAEIWTWAIAHWQLTNVPKQTKIAI
jgi:glutamyl-Q tRNA(Asp) synthetase